MNKPFIVAEIGANHNQNIGRALETIQAAAKAGADAVKFQTWMPGTMCLDRSYTTTWQGKEVSLADLYAEAWTPWEWHSQLFAEARRLGLVAFSTPFDKASVDFLETLSCPIYKIASFELVDLPLIRYVASKGKPMIMSTGMATKEEIQQAILCLSGHEVPWRNITLLKCTSAYPADASAANLASMAMMGVSVDCAFGLSDHTPGIGVAIAAAALGASVIEKHFTLSRADGGLDSEFSLEPQEFAQMVTECRRAAASIGEVRYGPGPGESTALRRSLYWARDMVLGQEVAADDLCTARPARGLPPSRLESLIGRTMDRTLKRGTPVAEGHLI